MLVRDVASGRLGVSEAFSRRVEGLVYTRGLSRPVSLSRRWRLDFLSDRHQARRRVGGQSLPLPKGGGISRTRPALAQDSLSDATWNDFIRKAGLHAPALLFARRARGDPSFNGGRIARGGRNDLDSGHGGRSLSRGLSVYPLGDENAHGDRPLLWAWNRTRCR